MPNLESELLRQQAKSAKLWLILILIAAAALRFGYQEGMLAFGGSFHNGSDSGKYLAIADTIYETGQFGRMSGGVVQEEVNRMPVYPYFLAGVFALFGKGNLYAVVLVQILLDIAMIAGLALAAAAIDRRLIVPVAAVAAVIPNFLVHVSYVLTETVFLFFFVWGLCATLWAIRGRRTGWLLAAAGICFGATLLTRPVMMFFPIALFVTLLVTLPRAAAANFGRRLVLAALPGIIVVAFAVPRVVENYRDYGVPILTNQSGTHLLKWIYPCLRTPWTCSSLGQAWKESEPIVRERIDALPESERANPARIDMVMREVGAQRIAELGAKQIALGMAVGMFKNIIQTGFYEVLTQFRQPPTFFSAMPGHTISERIRNFVTVNEGNLFMLFWAIAQATLLLSRGVQLVGVGAGLVRPETRPYVLFLVMTVAYFLVVSGPVADPKYRIPMEPALLILFSLGLYSMFDWVRARRRQSGQLLRHELA